ncbi:MAG: ATP-binding cassette domain-containing protein [Eubacteriales bacterium]|nr:ATP-binding cassette domain-containing protein [Eubacteriales bacterium]
MKEGNVVEVHDASMHFNMSADRIDSLKEYVVKLLKRQLFFKDFIAVDHVSLEIHKGEVFGIVGTNGSGKSTLLKMISGILKPTSGDVEISGNIAPLIELGAGFDGELTARENIYLNGAVLGYDKPFIDRHFSGIVDFAELWDFLDVPIKNYSSGMVARIAFAIATVIKPDILIVDEILSVGDFLFQQKCERRIRELMDGGTTVLIVSHSINQIESLCDRVLWIEKSKPVMMGSTFEVCNAYRNLQKGDHKEAPQEDRSVEVRRQKCPLCGQEDSVFSVDEGVMLRREARCCHCGGRLREADLGRTLMKWMGAPDKDLTQADALLGELHILDLTPYGAINKALKFLPHYQSWDYLRKVADGAGQDLGELPFADNTFDLVIDQEIANHYHDYEQAFREIGRVLKPGGLHLFSVPIHEGRSSISRAQRQEVSLTVEGTRLLVETDWGDDIGRIVDAYGFETTVEKCNQLTNIEDIPNVDETYEQCLTVPAKYYYRYNSIIITARKKNA